jgi:hypothetical protein
VVCSDEQKRNIFEDYDVIDSVNNKQVDGWSFVGEQKLDGKNAENDYYGKKKVVRYQSPIPGNIQHSTPPYKNE